MSGEAALRMLLCATGAPEAPAGKDASLRFTAITATAPDTNRESWERSVAKLKQLICHGLLLCFLMPANARELTFEERIEADQLENQIAELEKRLLTILPIKLAS